jgi:ABC-2 type transport system permease protein
MLWYKAWLDTRWRFVIGLAVMTCAAIFTVLSYPRVVALLPSVPPVETSGAIGRQIGEALSLLREYRGYVWSQWFRQSPTSTGILFAALLGTGGLVSSPSNGSALFTLSLPASRHSLVFVRAGSGLLQWAAIAFGSSLMIPLFSPAIGESYPLIDALIHGLCMFVAGAVIQAAALLLSTAFGDLWRPWLITLAIALPVFFAEQLSPDLSRFGLFGLMTGERFFRTGSMPWLGLLTAAAATAALTYAAAVNFSRRDF